MDDLIFEINGLEITPSLWEACECLTHPDLQIRRVGVQRLVETQAARHSPLVAYLLATKLSESDLSFRTYVAKILADLIDFDEHVGFPSETVRLTLIYFLAQMRTRQIFSLLQIADYDPSSTVQVARLIGACSFAGKHLLDILTNHDAPISIRQNAARFIGLVGYFDTAQGLERYLNRLETRKGVQTDLEDDASLIPLITESLNLLG